MAVCGRNKGLAKTYHIPHRLPPHLWLRRGTRKRMKTYNRRTVRRQTKQELRPLKG